MASTSWKIRPMGGVGEIGSNMTVFEFDHYQIIIDIGILFPYEDFFDINYLIPDFVTLDLNKKTYLVISHGHEDHIGAIAHLITQLGDFEVYAPAFAKELIHRKLQKNNLGCSVELYDANSELHFEETSVKPVAVNHSIPDTYGLIVKHDDTSVLFISDFKVDPKAQLEAPIDLKNIASLFATSTRRICMLDSTNILNPGKTPSETELIPDLERIIELPSRVFITLFSSNIHRVKNIINLAQKHNKKVVISGRSIWSYIDAAKSIGIISEEEFRTLIDYDQALPQSYIVLLTGCQGEFLGSLRRVANGEHPTLKLENGDIVLFSSKVIPGNEKKVARIINSITEKGAEVITSYDKLVHASGHPGQEDLRQIISAVNPTHYIPIHGETYFLKKHIDFVVKNFPSIQTFFMLNGDTLEVSSSLTLKKQESPQPEIIHGKNIVIERERISERRKIACNGSVFVSASKKDVVITTKGLPIFSDMLLDDLSDLIKSMFSISKNNTDEVSEKIRIFVRNFFKEPLGYKPIVIVHII